MKGVLCECAGEGCLSEGCGVCELTSLTRVLRKEIVCMVFPRPISSARMVLVL